MIESIEELRIFKQIVDSGSLTAAGAVLRLPVNTMSRRLARLEERLGTPLADRTTRRLRITDAGRELYASCIRVLEELDDVSRRLEPGARGVRGTLRINVTTATMLGGLVDVLSRALGEHAGLRLEVLVSDLPVDLLAAGCDVVMHVGRPADSVHMVRSVGRVTPALAAHRRYVQAHGEPATPRDLSAHECLVFLGRPPQTHWELFDAKGRAFEVPVSGRFASDDSRALQEALLAGLGIGLLAPHAIRQGTQLTAILPRYRLAPLEVFAIVPAGRSRDPKIRLAIDLLRDAVARFGGAAV